MHKLKQFHFLSESIGKAVGGCRCSHAIHCWRVCADAVVKRILEEVGVYRVQRSRLHLVYYWKKEACKFQPLFLSPKRCLCFFFQSKAVWSRLEAQATITTLFSSIFVLPGVAKGNTTDETGYSRHLSSKLNDKPTLVTQDNHGLLICWTVIHIDHQIFHWQIHYISLINVESNGKSPNVSPPISICQKYFQPF